ncbi:hypothetical protein RvY_00673 [Ramazzottius varieornatus]|uniref:Uncharacterized protein n=1 Tax=Ramazzottius varieornatus TaxID=947166 RepID=A0A1D1UHM6_RAMVA|nr:hypothetical protein RvY_00673 [Ramazzottius varieornatus]
MSDEIAVAAGEGEEGTTPLAGKPDKCDLGPRGKRCSVVQLPIDTGGARKDL